MRYPLTKYTIQPFADHDLMNDPLKAADQKAWNILLSQLRVAVENAFGCLKGRFPALRNFPGHNIHQMYCTVEALLIVHNIVEEFGDDPTTIDGFNGVEDPHAAEAFQACPDRLDEDDLFWTGLLQRKALMNYSKEQLLL
ncbi:hypothetical protein HWV62_16700 [Athelia sp. TMB]|nr:hypothetical protein HWV62_16700 [Athelia sp. TMB]